MGEPPHRPPTIAATAGPAGGPIPAPAGHPAPVPRDTGPTGSPVAGAGHGPNLTPQEGTALLEAAVRAIAARLTGLPFDMPRPVAGALAAAGASFVTLHARGRLRGCLGTLDPVRPLHDDVVFNARRATTDPRLPPVAGADWPDLEVTVSVLGTLEPLVAASRAGLVRLLRPGVDGLVIEDGRHRRVTFLPTVWGKLPDADRFVSALLAKGGWSTADWPDGLATWRYRTVEYVDHAPRGPLDKAG